VVLSKVDPEYSEDARKAKYSGQVTLSVVVGTDGKAENIRVVRSLGMGLDEKAVEAVQQWRFRPGTIKGVAVRVRAQILVTFRLL
jgi:TonB family protein